MIELERIIYLDNYIKLFCKLDKKEQETITPVLVQYITLSYSIGLIDNPGRQVTEQIKIDKKDIRFIEDYIVTSFMITGLHNPNICEMSLKKLNIYLKDSPRYSLSINKTHTFKSIQSGISPISEKIKVPKSLKILHKITPVKKTEIQVQSKSKKRIQKSEKVLFTEAYEKFKVKIKETDLNELLRKKTGSVEFNLKNFGISLLCKTLLLVKQVNELVDNEFQNDLQEFLKKNIFESIKEEVSV